MVGLEIIVNDLKPIIAASDSLVFIDLSHGYSYDQISVIGGNELYMLRWFQGEPKRGDKILIRVIETEIVSSVASIKKRDIDEIKELYECYEVELKNRGLL